MRIRVVGAERVADEYLRAAVKFRPGLLKRLTESAALVERNAKLAIRGSRTRARRKGRAVTARKNELGTDTGRLRQSISFDVFSRGKRLFAEIGPQRVVYARIHEYGGKAGRARAASDIKTRLTIAVGSARIPPRPYMGPALKRSESKIVELIGRAFRVI